MLLLLHTGLVQNCFLLVGKGGGGGLGAYNLFGLSVWALIQGGHLFKGGQSNKYGTPYQ